MMAMQIKNDREVKEAIQENKNAFNENSLALHSLLECIYGVGAVSKERLDKLRSRAGEDGKGNPRGL